MAQVLTKEGLLAEKVSERYQSLDVLRGLTIALMVVVNTPGSWSTIYGPLEHAKWHGFTITDWVFPSFLFVVGNAMSFSMKKFEQQGQKVFLQKVFKRTALIFLIGIFLQVYPLIRFSGSEYVIMDFSNFRIMGVLQRIALCYCIASLVMYYFKMRGAAIFSMTALLGYWAVMFWFGEGADPYSLEGNAALKLDLFILGASRLYTGEGIPFDPEGLLSTIPAVVNVIGGYYAGVYIQKHGNTKQTVLKMIYVGFALVAMAYAWDIFFPINKKIWTSSYVLLTIGMNLLAIALLMLIIEVAKMKNWTYFFEVFGRNPLVLYALSGMVIKTMVLIRIGDKGLHSWSYDTLFLSWLEGKNASLLFALSYMLLIWIMGYYMDKKKIYIKV